MSHINIFHNWAYVITAHFKPISENKTLRGDVGLGEDAVKIVYR